MTDAEICRTSTRERDGRSLPTKTLHLTPSRSWTRFPTTCEWSLSWLQHIAGSTRMKFVMTRQHVAVCSTRRSLVRTNQLEGYVRTVWRKGRTTLLHLCEGNMYRMWIWLVSSALDPVEGNVWTAHTQQSSLVDANELPLLSALSGWWQRCCQSWWRTDTWLGEWVFLAFF